MGSLQPSSILKGVIGWDYSYKKAYTNGTYGMGTFNVGTVLMVGTIFPRGGTNPFIAGTFAPTGGNLSNMAAESVDAVNETETGILYNVTITD